MSHNDPKYGITGPASFKESSKEDQQMTKKLEKYLRDSDFFESEDAAQTRERVLGKLDHMLKNFVNKCNQETTTNNVNSYNTVNTTVNKTVNTTLNTTVNTTLNKTVNNTNLSNNVNTFKYNNLNNVLLNKNYGGKIFTFGSYRLGVHDKGADIDVLCVVPRHVLRKDFFTIFYDDLSKEPGITELSKVEEAYAPLIKLKFFDIPIDMTFARLNLPVVKENTTLLNDAILKSMDEKCITSLNGSRVTDAMLHLVPNVEVFHTTLRAIKFWAKRRAIYGNTYGYFGGVAYSISVARICQMYPNACAYEVLYRYFEIYSSWKWPAPVQLCPIIDHNYNMKVWDPKTNPADKYHKMPIITPVYPARCATHNVMQSSFNFMCSELTRGYEKLKAKASFEELFEKTNFFSKHKIYVEISIECDTEESFNAWEGFIESKIRILATKLESLECITAAIPFPKSFRIKKENTRKNIKLEDKSLEETFSKNNISKIDNASKQDNTPDSIHNDNIQSNLFNNDLTNRINFNSKDEFLEIDDGDSPLELKAWFYIALDIYISSSSNKKFYIGDPINEFMQFVKTWESKTSDMKIEINSRKKKEVQSLNFIKELK